MLVQSVGELKKKLSEIKRVIQMLRGYHPEVDARGLVNGASQMEVEIDHIENSKAFKEEYNLLYHGAPVMDGIHSGVYGEDQPEGQVPEKIDVHEVGEGSVLHVGKENSGVLQSVKIGTGKEKSTGNILHVGK